MTVKWRDIEPDLAAFPPAQRQVVRELIALEVARERFRVVREFMACADAVVAGPSESKDGCQSAPGKGV